MSPEAYVTALYRLVLGREPDPEGLRHWAAAVAHDGAPAVLAGLLASEEYQARSAPPSAPSLPAPLATGLAGEAITVVDVGAQALAAENHVYEPLRAAGLPLRIIGFEPLAERRRERERTETGPGLTLLPYAIGDGGEHRLHVNNEDATSSLYPLNATLNRDFEHLAGLATLRTEPVRTRQLDEVLPLGPVAFLKLDIQGAELSALRGAEQVLAHTAVVHCEVEFAPIYQGQPLFPQVQAHLNARGFALIDLLVAHRYSYLVPSGRRSSDRLLWADAVFFRETEEPATLLVQALVALLVYRKRSLAEHLLHRRDRLTGDGLAALID